ncbi:MAG: hypothetical protein SFW36_22110 [Leptolyngbyaceae cyanobacterium bins.59]|nr:hypothetical protein [Leptolyngbyaceae cyanobacterium bins.59]
MVRPFIPQSSLGALLLLCVSLSTACTGEQAASPPPPTPTIAPTPTPIVQAPVPQQPPTPQRPTPNPQPAAETYPIALDVAEGATVVSRSAQSPSDWALVASQWENAIRLMKTVPSSSPQAANARRKVTEYERELANAQRQAKLSAEATPESSIQGLSLHLKKVGAKMYGAFWCPYCSRQEEDFGKFFANVTYVECDPRGKNPQPQVCRDAGIVGFPTWEVNGQFLRGYQSLEELATASGYKGPRRF